MTVLEQISNFYCPADLAYIFKKDGLELPEFHCIDVSCQGCILSWLMSDVPEKEEEYENN